MVRYHLLNTIDYSKKMNMVHLTTHDCNY